MAQSEIEKTLEEMHKYIEDAMTKNNITLERLVNND